MPSEQKDTSAYAEKVGAVWQSDTDRHVLNQDVQTMLADLEGLKYDLMNLLASSNMAALFLDQNLRIRRYTSAARRVFQLDPEQDNQSFGEVAHSLCHDDLHGLVKHVFTHREGWDGELSAEDGRWYEVRILPYQYASQQFDGVVVSLVDITERKHAEEELRQSEERWRRLVELHPEPIMISVGGTVVYSNPAGARVFGGEHPDDICGHSVFDFILPDLHEVFGDRLVQLQQGQASEPLEHKARRLDGEIRDVVAFSVPITYAGQRAAQTVIRDITQRKRAQRALQNEQDFISAVLDTVGALVVVIDRAGCIVRFNRTCEQVTGFTKEEATGRPFIEFVPPEERCCVQSQFDRLFAGERHAQHESRWLTRDDRPRLIAWSNTILCDEDGTTQYIIGTGIDITEQRLLEKAVLHITEEERQRIGRDLHDELGSHLAGITMLIRGLIRDVRTNRTVRIEDLEDIGRLVAEGTEKARALAQGLNPVHLEAQGLLIALQDLAEGSARLTSMDIAFQTDLDALPLSLEVATQLYWMAQEAVSNAMKHAQADHVRIRLDRDDEDGSDKLVLTIEDDGTGIATDAKRQPGMGLHTMEYRARLIGAVLAIESGPACGTRVQCILPIKHP